MKTLLLVCVMFCLLGYGQGVDENHNLYKIFKAANGLKKNDVESARNLMQYSLEKQSKEVSYPLIKTVTLMLIKTNSKQLADYMTKIKTANKNALKFLDLKPFQKDCYKCKGKGLLESQCKECKNGKCRNCGGKKIVSYRGLGGKTEKKKCPTCEPTNGKCRQCKGAKVIKNPCKICKEKGSFFTKGAVPAEFKKSLDHLLAVVRKQAVVQKINIGLDKSATAKIQKSIAESEKAALAKKEAAEAKRKSEELARLNAKKKQQEAQAVADAMVIEGPPAENKSSLDHAVLEVTNYIDAQQKRTGANIYVKAYGKFKDGQPTLYLQLSTPFMKSKKSERNQILDGFSRFWKLRAMNNGLGEDVNFKPYFNNKVVSF